jgi:DNA-binding NtrC family response regulator
MLPAEELTRLQKVARLRALDLSRNHHDREDIEQEALLAALQKPEFSTKAARWGASDEAARQRRARRSAIDAGIPRPPRREALEFTKSGRFARKGEGVTPRVDHAALAALPTVKQVVDDLVRRALAAADGRQKEAAAAIGMGYRTLKTRLRSWRARGLPC